VCSTSQGNGGPCPRCLRAYPGVGLGRENLENHGAWSLVWESRVGYLPGGMVAGRAVEGVASIEEIELLMTTMLLVF